MTNKEEPVSEELNKEMDNYLASVFTKDMDGGEPRFTTWFKALCKTARHFANWQKEQFEKNRLKHCDSITNEQAELEQKFLDQHLDKYNRMPTFLDAIEYGMKLKEEQKTSVWHDPKDSPKYGSIIVINNDQTTLSVEYTGRPLDGVDKWAYLDELLKL